MPIEVRELIIRAAVQSQQPAREARNAAPPLDEEALVARCVEQVLEALRETRER